MGHRVCGRREAHDGAARSLGASRDRDHHEREELPDAQAPVVGLVMSEIVIEGRSHSQTTAQETVGTTIVRWARVYHPLFAATEEIMRNENRRAYGNDAPVEITKRFPQALGNLAQNARFPHSHRRSSVFQIRRA